MGLIGGVQSVDGLLDLLCERAVRGKGAPRTLVNSARSATLRNLGHLGSVDLDPASVSRIENYYFATLRRLSARTNAPEAQEYRRRAIATSLASDLREAGLDEAHVVAEVAACIGSDAERFLRGG